MINLICENLTLDCNMRNVKRYFSERNTKFDLCEKCIIKLSLVIKFDFNNVVSDPKRLETTMRLQINKNSKNYKKNNRPLDSYSILPFSKKYRAV